MTTGLIHRVPHPTPPFVKISGFATDNQKGAQLTNKVTTA